MNKSSNLPADSAEAPVVNTIIMRTSKIKHAVLIALALLPALAALGQTPYYVDASRPDDSGDGLSWGAAKKTIQAAVSLANDGDTIWVRAGTYSVPAESPILIEKGITIRSELGGLAGAEVTIVEGPGTSATLNSRVFTLNHADAELHGLMVRNGRVTGTGNNGGGIQMTGGLVSHCIVTNNTTQQHSGGGNGGGLYRIGGVVSNSLILKNTAGGNGSSGGGVSVTSNGLVTLSVIEGNSINGSGSSGGGVLMTTGSLLRNSIVCNNNSGNNNGGGVTGGTIENCTIVNNLANGSGGGVANSMVTNSIVFFNTGSETIVDNHSGATFTRSCTSPLPAGTGNTALNPEFEDPGTGNYRIMPGSPARDAGMVLAWMAGATDLDGNPRIHGSAPDMGAYEITPEALAADFIADVLFGIEPLEVVFTAAVSGTNTSGLFYRWDIGNTGSFDIEGSDKAVITNTFGAGLYDIRLVVTNAAAETSTRLREGYIAATKDVLHVAVGNAGAAAPYMTWATAAASITDALAVAANGAEVVVTNGTFDIIAEIHITRGIKLRSINGPEPTIIRRTSGNARIFRIDHADAVLDGFTIRDASWGGSGAGIYMTGGLVNNCIITNNATAAQYSKGAGVYMIGGIISNSAIVNNTLSGVNSFTGGGLYMTNGALASHCLIAGNGLASSYGSSAGGVFMDASSALRNCLVRHNHAALNAAPAGGVRGGTVESCTIVGNQASIGGGVYESTVINSIVYENSAIDSDYDNHYNSTFSYSCTLPLPASGDGNTALNPDFVDAGALDYRIKSSSPARDTGDNKAWMVDAVDLIGNPRIFNTIVDMGAYELVPTVLDCDFTADVRVGMALLDVVFTSAVAGTNTTALYYRWDLDNDGTFDVEGYDKAIITNVFGLGTHSIRLQVTNAVAEVAEAVRPDFIVATGPTLYVAEGNAGAAAPYAEWATAAVSIADALAIATDGTEVVVTNGTYDITAQLEILRDVTVRSVNGPEVTIVRRSSGTSRILRMAHSNAVLEGFTIRDGDFSGSGAGIHMTGGLVENCIITNNTQSAQTARGGGVYMDGGVVRNCVIAGNVSSPQHTRGGGIALFNGALAEHCVIFGNSVTSGNVTSGGGVFIDSTGGTLRNSLVFNNHVASGGGQGGGGVDGGTVVNCTIVENLASTGGGTYNSTVVNSIVYDNSATTGPNYSGGGLSYTCTTPLPAGEGNIEDDPLFIDAVGRDYRLPAESPCINTGTNQDWMIGNTDLDGNPRIARRRVDMGAYELKSARSIIVKMR